MPRLFTALEIPRSAALSLSLLRGGIPGARWIDVENYHITLRFIGDVDGRTADEIVDRLDRIDRPEFSMTLNGIGSFGSKKPHSIWAGVSPAPELYALQGEIDERRQTEARLAVSEQRFRAIFDSTFQFIGLLAPDAGSIEVLGIDLAGAPAAIEGCWGWRSTQRGRSMHGCFVRCSRA